MSKLGAICDKLRQYGPSDTFPAQLVSVPDTGSPAAGKREASPDEPSQRLNKRKNFRPVSNSSRNGPSTSQIDAESSRPAVDEVSETRNVSAKVMPELSEEQQSQLTVSSPPQSSAVTSVIVRNPKAQELKMEFTEGRHLPESFPLREEGKIARRTVASGYRLPSPPASSSSFYPTQVFPFMDYQNMMFDAHLRQLDKEHTNGRIDEVEDVDDDDSLDDSDDGKFSNGERHSGADGKPAINRKRRETSSHDSANSWKWSGVRNSIRSLDIWQYVKHFRSDESCHTAECRSLGLKEHFHCLTCTNPNKVIFRKEEMIRHVKWHKKRDETLQLGFLRFSGNDDCLQQFRGCPHAGRQTHYHCLMAPCQKVYTSTSDVQMHANLHRKEMAINKEGFQRYRAMDDCREEGCPFRQQKSTHFHCIRSSCNFTFKNKADMEKHKAYHAKNDELAKDGFRKYMKYEYCLFDACPYSKIMNHIHCIRSGCRYVFTSSAQLHAHKRKHDKHTILKSSSNMESSLPPRSYDSGSSNASSDLDELPPAVGIDGLYGFSSDDDDDNNNEKMAAPSMDRGGFSPPPSSSPAFAKSEKVHNGKVKFNTALLRAAEAANMRSKLASGGDFLMPAGETTTSRINHGDGAPPARKNMSLSHSTLHADNGRGSPYSDFLTTAAYPSAAHREHTSFHRNQISNHSPYDLSTVNGSIHSKPASVIGPPNSMNSALTSQMASMQPSYPPFKRKRGRPPKNPVVDVHIFPSAPNSNRNPQAMFSSFKIGKGGILMDIRQESAVGHKSMSNGHSSPQEKPRERNILPKLSQFTERMPNKSPNCDYQSCTYAGRDHYHCTHPRCHFGSERDDILALHTREFHQNIIILDGYEFYDQCVDCGLAGCPSNQLTRHFHCTRPSCLYSFVRYDTMGTHEEKHRLASSTPTRTTPSPASTKSTVKMEPTDLSTHNEPRTSPQVSRESNGHYVKSEPEAPGFQEKRFFCHPMLSKMHFTADQPCALMGRCRLAEREHFHCDRCDFAYTSPLRLQTHLSKCQVEPPAPRYTASPGFASSPHPLQQQFSTNSASTFSPKSSPPSSNSFLDFDSDNGKDRLPPAASGSNGQTKIKFISMAFPQTGRVNGQQQQPILEGFQRFLCTETCDWEECPLARKQTHWHCREDHCRQFFSDKTRLERHSERHRRLSTIIGDDFRRYSAKVTCDDPTCSLKSSSHVHCLQCEFVCTETAKISTHRRSHSKQNAVKNAGFDKYSFRSPCSVSSCLYYTQTHYHCKTCSVVVNTMSQMQAHQNKHDQRTGNDDGDRAAFNCDPVSDSF